MNRADRPKRMPPWLKVKVPSGRPYAQTAGVLHGLHLNTVCHEAHCPNAGACWSAGTATIMILGDQCTRACRFCAVGTKAAPPLPEPDEPERVALGVKRMGLRYAVITSVTRDDLPDGGAEHFSRTVRAIRAQCPDVLIELLIPDMQGDEAALDVILQAKADIVGHNLETVRRMTDQVRDPRTSYERSLEVLKYVGTHGAVTKSAMLLGMGETDEEVLHALSDLRAAGVSHVALGQYLAPSDRHSPVRRYVHPDDFSALEERCRRMGFSSVAAAPFVRSSYRAGDIVGPTCGVGAG